MRYREHIKPPIFYILAAVVFLALLLAAIGSLYPNAFSIHPGAWAGASVPLPTAQDPNFLAQVTDCFLPVAAAYGYNLRITAGFRSLADQTQLYDQGRTVDGHIVSEAPPGHSIHNYGFAVDVADRVRGYSINWTRLIKIAEYCRLESGGAGDLPHFEYRGGLTTDQFASGMRPPPLALPCPLMAERIASNTPLTLKDLNSCGAPKF